MSTAGSDDGCFFCRYFTSDEDGADFVLWRSDTVAVVLNAFPYNTGHVMVAPLNHVGSLPELSDAERSALFDATYKATQVIDAAMSPQGFNVGMNLGLAAGAGVPDHLHMHVVPRWGGDTNFMTTISETKVLPEMLAETYAKLRPGF